MTYKPENKSDLLNKLTIDRDHISNSVGISIGKVIGIALLSIIFGGLITHYFLEPDTAESSLNNAITENKVHSSNTPLQETHTENPIAPSKNKNTVISTNTTILNASGYITARRMATVSSQVMGLIEQVNVEEGMSVQKGQILAQLDDSIARVRLEQAEAQVESLKTQLQSAATSLTEAKIQYRRVMNNRYSSEADKTRTETNRKLAVSAINQIKADIKVAEIGVKTQKELVDDHTIRAPFSGIVTMKNAQPGEIVAPSSAGGGFTRTGICTIVDMNSLEIEVDVNESFIGRVNAGQQVEAQLDAYPDWNIPASVIAIIPTADRGKATVRVRIKIELKDPKILPDMGVKVAFFKSKNQE